MKNNILFIFIILTLTVTIMGCSNDASGENGNSENVDLKSEQIRFTVFTSAGGAGDVFSRNLAKTLEEDLGFENNVVVENRDGGNGAIAINHMLNAPADGNTLLYHTSTAPLSMASGEVEFTPEDLQPIASILADNLGIYVRDDSPYETLEDLIADAKENDNTLNVAGAQSFGINHYFALLFMREAGIDLNYISYPGGGEAITSLLGGNADLVASSVEVANSQLQSGDVRMLAVTGEERRDEYPDVPTFEEEGLSNFDNLVIWRGLFVHPDTPQEVQDSWTEILSEVLDSEEFVTYAQNSNQIEYFNAGEDFEEIFQNDFESAEEIFSEVDEE